MEVYKFNSETDTYELVVDIKNDGTVIGESPLAARIEKVLTEIEKEGLERTEVIGTVFEILERRYNTGSYSTKR